jgi:hypothetical protein
MLCLHTPDELHIDKGLLYAISSYSDLINNTIHACTLYCFTLKEEDMYIYITYIYIYIYIYIYHLHFILSEGDWNKVENL